jgi:hypothetical protein
MIVKAAADLGGKAVGWQLPMKCSAVWLSVADKLATALAPIKTAHIGQHHVSATCTKVAWLIACD